MGNRCGRAVDNHVGRTGAGEDFVYYDTFMRRKINEVTAQSRTSAVCVVSNIAPTGWEHDEEDVECVPRDTGVEYCPGVPVYPLPEQEHPFVPE